MIAKDSQRRALVPTWLVWMLATLLLWGVWGVLLRLAPIDLTAGQVQALSTLGMLPVLLLMAFTGRGIAPEGASRREIGLALTAGAVSCLGNVAFYAALARAPASVVVPLTAMSPAVAVLLAAALLGERLGPLQWLGIGLSLASIGLLNLTQGDEGDASWLPLAIVPLALWGVTLVLQKLATRTLDAGVAAWWFLAAFVPFGVTAILAEPLANQPTASVWCVAFGLGLTLGLGNVTVMASLATGGRASIVGPLSGLYPIVTIPLAMLLLGERLSMPQLAGVALALLAVWLLSQESAGAAEPTNPSPSLHSGAVSDEALP